MRTRIGFLSMALVAGCGLGGPRLAAGRVLSASGQPLAGVVVSGPSGSTLTDAAGKFQLTARDPSLRFRKPGFQTATVLSGQVAEVRLADANGPIRVSWDDRWSNPPSEGLKSWIAGKGLAVQTLEGGSMPESDVIVLLSPSFFTKDAAHDIVTAVKSGATLVLGGEWGGYAGVDLGALNLIGSQAGISFDGSLIRTRSLDGVPEWISPTVDEPALVPARPPILMSAGTLSVAGSARAFARSATNTYRVAAWTDGPLIVGAVAPLGAGKIVATSDASCFADSTEGSLPGWQNGGNAEFALKLITY